MSCLWFGTERHERFLDRNMNLPVRSAHNQVVSNGGSASGFANSGSTSGITTIGLMLALVVVFTAFLGVIEFYRLFTVRMSIEEELGRAVSIAADTSMLDVYRREHVSELNPAVASKVFYEYLHESMGASSDLVIYDKKGRVMVKLYIEQLKIINEPPSIHARGSVGIRPLFIGELFTDEIRLTVRGSSVNRRKDI